MTLDDLNAAGWDKDPLPFYFDDDAEASLAHRGCRKGCVSTLNAVVEFLDSSPDSAIKTLRGLRTKLILMMGDASPLYQTTLDEVFEGGAQMIARSLPEAAKQTIRDVTFHENCLNQDLLLKLGLITTTGYMSVLQKWSYSLTDLGVQVQHILNK